MGAKEMRRSFFTLLRLCARRRYFLSMAACILLVLCELVELMLTSYGSANGSEFLGIDLPPLVLAAEAFGRSAAIWLLVPLSACSYAGEYLADGYASLMLSGGRGARGIALRFMLATVLLSACSALMICTFSLLVCSVFCQGALDSSFLLQLSKADVRVLSENAWVGYGFALLVGMLRVVAIGVISMGIALTVRWRFAGVLALPLVWLLLTYTPAMNVAAIPSYSLMGYLDTPESFYSFLGSEALFCGVSIGMALFIVMRFPRALQVRSGIYTSKGTARKGKGHV